MSYILPHIHENIGDRQAKYGCFYSQSSAWRSILISEEEENNEWQVIKDHYLGSDEGPLCAPSGAETGRDKNLPLSPCSEKQKALN